MQEFRVTKIGVVVSPKENPVLRSWEPERPRDPIKMTDTKPIVPEFGRDEVLISTRYSSRHVWQRGGCPPLLQVQVKAKGPLLEQVVPAVQRLSQQFGEERNMVVNEVGPEKRVNLV